MNTFGRLFRISLFGESHGDCVGILIDGCPAGLSLSTDDFIIDLGRRRSGHTGTTARQEADLPALSSGIFNGKTTGAAILILFENGDINSSAYENLKKTPRPGQADLAAYQKYGGYNDYRGGGMFSGRLTAALVAAGVIAKKMIQPVSARAELIEAGGSRKIDEAVEEARLQGDSLGGIIECRTSPVPPGLGEPLLGSAESLLSHLLFSIPGIKGVEFGAGFVGSRMTGSAYNDQIISPKGETRTNNAGGVNGGITNGNELVFRVAVRPTASIAKTQRTMDLETGEERQLSIGGRHDVCFALRVPVIVEAVTAIALADMMLMEQKIPRIAG
jgi:chorismate synthase